jgi:hypothetical protein
MGCMLMRCTFSNASPRFAARQPAPQTISRPYTDDFQGIRVTWPGYPTSKPYLAGGHEGVVSCRLR